MDLSVKADIIIHNTIMYIKSSRHYGYKCHICTCLVGYACSNTTAQMTVNKEKNDKKDHLQINK